MKTILPTPVTACGSFKFVKLYETACLLLVQPDVLLLLLKDLLVMSEGQRDSSS